MLEEDLVGIRVSTGGSPRHGTVLHLQKPLGHPLGRETCLPEFSLATRDALLKKISMSSISVRNTKHFDCLIGQIWNRK